jgi:hypothetical protein
LPRTLLDDTHTVPASALPPTRPRALRSTAPTLDTTTVKLTDPVVGPFVVTTLLTANDTPPKLTPRLKLDRVRPLLNSTLTPLSDPKPALHPTLLDDTHCVPCPELPLIRDPTLRSTPPTDNTNTVMLTPPVVGLLVGTVLLSDRDTSP